MMRVVLLAFLLGVPVSAHAAVIFSQTNESFTAGDSCTELTASVYTYCRQSGAGHANSPETVTIATSIPGYSGPMPSGSKVIRVWTDAINEQADAGVGIGDAGNATYDNYIPADAWWQVAIYINNYGAEVPANLVDRPMKLFYPCADNYPCGSATYGGYFLIETARHTSYEPHNSTALSADTTGAMWIVSRDNTEGTPNYTGAAPGDENKLGQTNLSEWLKPNRWNILKCHTNFTNTSAASLECWLGPMGGAMTKIMSWVGGVAVEGSAFSWTVPRATGHRQMIVPSTQPANNTFPQTLYTYYDDFTVATTEADLPTYGAASSPATFNPSINLRRSELEILRDDLTAFQTEQAARWAGLCAVVNRTRTTWALTMRREIPC